MGGLFGGGAPAAAAAPPPVAVAEAKPVQADNGSGAAQQYSDGSMRLSAASIDSVKKSQEKLGSTPVNRDSTQIAGTKNAAIGTANVGTKALLGG